MELTEPEIIELSDDEETETMELTEEEINELLETSSDDEGIDPVTEQGNDQTLILAATWQGTMEAT